MIRFVQRMAVESQGEGDAVLMIHGLGGTSNTWTPLMPALARYRVVRPDLPGSGRSVAVEGPLSIARMVEYVVAACEALEVGRAHVAGHSLGCIVALHLAVAHPSRVRSLALFGPLLAPPDIARENLRARAQKARASAAAGMQEIADALLVSTTSRDTRERRPLAVAVARESLMRQDPFGYARVCEALSDARPAAVENISCPTLLVTGDEDIIAPPQAVRVISERIVGSRVVIFPRCGHWTTFERPEECAEALRTFYSQRI
jgi:3-oxoadipate enol-lactonase